MNRMRPLQKILSPWVIIQCEQRDSAYTVPGPTQTRRKHDNPVNIEEQQQTIFPGPNGARFGHFSNAVKSAKKHLLSYPHSDSSV